MTIDGRLLGIDYGEKRIGLAISDPLGMTAQPLGYILNSKTCIDELVSLINEKSVKRIIIGLPLNQDGNDSPKSLEVRKFADKLKQATNISIEFKDERFSTAAVTRHLISADVKRKKRKEIVDTQAAMFILQGVLDSSG